MASSTLVVVDRGIAFSMSSSIGANGPAVILLLSSDSVSLSDWRVVGLEVPRRGCAGDWSVGSMHGRTFERWHGRCPVVVRSRAGGVLGSLPAARLSERQLARRQLPALGGRDRSALLLTNWSSSSTTGSGSKIVRCRSWGLLSDGCPGASRCDRFWVGCQGSVGSAQRTGSGWRWSTWDDLALMAHLEAAVGVFEDFHLYASVAGTLHAGQQLQDHLPRPAGEFYAGVPAAGSTAPRAQHSEQRQGPITSPPQGPWPSHIREIRSRLLALTSC